MLILFSFYIYILCALLAAGIPVSIADFVTAGATEGRPDGRPILEGAFKPDGLGRLMVTYPQQASLLHTRII